MTAGDGRTQARGLVGWHLGGTTKSRAGMTMVEIMVAFSALTAGMLAFCLVILSSNVATETNHQVTVAKEAARQMIEELQAEALSNVFARYNASDADDPGGIGTAPGDGFEVAGLDVADGDADGMCGTILFPVDPANSSSLREDIPNSLFATPRDLSGDGVPDALNHAGDYQILPVVVRIEWRCATGPARLEFRALLGGI